MLKYDVACDPFSKRGGKSVTDTIHDEPPEMFEKRGNSTYFEATSVLIEFSVNNSKKRKQHDWDDEAQRELILQREAMRNLKAMEQKERQKEAVKIEPQKEGESLREFKKRVREGTRKVSLFLSWQCWKLNANCVDAHGRTVEDDCHSQAKKRKAEREKTAKEVKEEQGQL